ncbi:hypothetical protein HZ326_8692 [Fusarium oxysporum f. sp. albedinis]|nr:hypothetical protein HZ326_8692 [Fusarium oxysporum f. sp. albedinis]
MQPKKLFPQALDQNFQRWRVHDLGVIACIFPALAPRISTLPTSLIRYREKSRLRASTPNLANPSPLVAHFIHTKKISPLARSALSDRPEQVERQLHTGLQSAHFILLQLHRQLLCCW